MNTELIYLHDAYLREVTARVVNILEENNQFSAILDKTIFYPQGGGQPSDQGEIIGLSGTLEVNHVSYNNGEPLHKGHLTGTLKIGDEVQLRCNWDLRYTHMQWHTAGHIVDQAVKNVLPDADSIDGNHGIGKKMYIEFATDLSKVDLSKIQEQTDRIVKMSLSISTEMITFDELIKRKIKLPFDLPQNKSLRAVQIGQYPVMPDGGTHLKLTDESQPITITQIIQKDGGWRVVYEVNKMDVKKLLTQVVEELSPISFDSSKQLPNSIELIKSQLKTETGPDLRIKYLGKKGLFNQVSQVLKVLDPRERKEAGQKLNEFKTYLEQEILNKEQSTNAKSTWIDLTAPGIEPKVGHIHPVSQAMEEITHIFEQIGFTRVRYPEVDWDHYVFEALNMPPDHPARDEWETFFMDAPIDQKMGKIVLTTHTSNGQVREMERLNSQPPIRMINMGRCYRRQQDATHTQMFHQFEGLVVDKGINIQHLKGTLDYFAEQFYGPGTKSRIRPFHFQFTEPSFEVDFSCHLCDGTGQVKVDAEVTKCKFCKSGWHEVGGAGMVHPNVLKAGGIDPNIYTGFAFGWGVERTYTLKKGLNIDDIRLLYSGDMRFLEQF